MDTCEQLARIDQALLQAHQERTAYHQASMGAHRLQRADLVLSALTAGAVFVWTVGGVTLALRLAGYS